MSKIDVKWEDGNRLVLTFEDITNPEDVALHVAKWLGQSQDETLIYVAEKIAYSIINAKSD